METMHKSPLFLDVWPTHCDASKLQAAAINNSTAFFPQLKDLMYSVHINKQCFEPLFVFSCSSGTGFWSGKSNDHETLPTRLKEDEGSVRMF